MPSKMTFLFGVPLFVGCCTILWMFWDRFKKPSKPPPSDQICPNKLSDNQNEAQEEEMAEAKAEEKMEEAKAEEKMEEAKAEEKMEEAKAEEKMEEAKAEEKMEEAKAEETMEEAIFISGDCWLAVFELLPAYQLGLRISMISHRFDIYVDEHFKTRKWGLDFLRIGSKIGENGTKEVEIVNYDGEQLPIPQIELPRKVIGFECIIISFIDQNAIDFLRRFRQLFATRPINLAINTYNNRILEFIFRNIWPMLVETIDGMQLSVAFFNRLRQFVPSILNDCLALRVFSFNTIKYTDFTFDDSAAASDEQAVAQWLFTPHPNNVPKVFKCLFRLADDDNLGTNIAAFRTAFTNASSPANFIVVIWFPSYFDQSSVEPFDLTNELTREQLALKGTNFNNCFLLIRSPIARDANKWAEWEEEAIGWNFLDQCDQIDIQINDEEEIGDGLLNATPGPSDQQK